MIVLSDDAVIEAHAQAHGLDPTLVRAQVLVESGGATWAWNPEPRYRYLWDVAKRRPFRALTNAEADAEAPPPDFPTLHGDRDQEWWGQQASWGLLQVMGAVARELGFSGPYLTELCRPEVGMHYGCLYLAKLRLWAGGDTDRMLAAYNGGYADNKTRPFRNQAYADKVTAARILIDNGQRT